MQCPICKKPVTLRDPEAPFCSERCKNNDFGAWASESYRVAEPAAPLDDEPGADAAPRH